MIEADVLNKEQREAVEHIEGPLLVLAGAGSGKTRIVTHRIALLLSLGVPSEKIIAVTFTNKAANEMRQRIEKMANAFVFISTFHSLCAYILRESIHHLGFTRDFTIYDDEDQKRLLKETVKELGLKGEKGEVKSFSSKISKAKNDLISSHQIEKEDTELAAIYAAYQKKLKQCNALDFDDLLFLTVQLFKTFPNVLEVYQNRWSFLLIDEYQDTNGAQYQIAKFLSGKTNNIFAVGDPDQSIYSWRGANVVNILNFERDFPGAKVITLQQNYRSSNAILKAANSLIKINERKYKKELWSELGEGAKPVLHYCKNEHEEVEFVTDQIKKIHRKQQIPLSECAIFYRTNFQSRIFEDSLIKEKIPYEIYGGLSFYQRKEVKDVISLLRFIHNENDYLAFLRTINLPKRGLGLSTLSKIKEFAESSNSTLLEACSSILQGKMHVSKRQYQGIEEYLSLCHFIKGMVATNSPLDHLLAKAIQKWGYLDILKADPETFEDRRDNIAEFIAKAAHWKCAENENVLTRFLEDLTLKSERDNDNTNLDKVHLMTLHNSKGLEFSVVFLVGMEEDLFPHVNCRDLPKSLEEERRLCYVGMTRAKKQLYLTNVGQRFLWGFSRFMRPSRFLEEIAPELIDTPPENSNNQSVMIGSRVQHSNFGKGTVTKIYETSYGLTYDVFFSELNTNRSLVAKFAKLSLI